MPLNDWFTGSYTIARQELEALPLPLEPQSGVS